MGGQPRCGLTTLALIPFAMCPYPFAWCLATFALWMILSRATIAIFPSQSNAWRVHDKQGHVFHFPFIVVFLPVTSLIYAHQQLLSKQEALFHSYLRPLSRGDCKYHHSITRSFLHGSALSISCIVAHLVLVSISLRAVSFAEFPLGVSHLLVYSTRSYISCHLHIPLHLFFNGEPTPYLVLSMVYVFLPPREPDPVDIFRLVWIPPSTKLSSPQSAPTSHIPTHDPLWFSIRSFHLLFTKDVASRDGQLESDGPDRRVRRKTNGVFTSVQNVGFEGANVYVFQRASETLVSAFEPPLGPTHPAGAGYCVAIVKSPCVPQTKSTPKRSRGACTLVSILRHRPFHFLSSGSTPRQLLYKGQSVLGVPIV
eukprot:scaffold416_cov329-Pavlova_lutheri.AAC.33